MFKFIIIVLGILLSATPLSVNVDFINNRKSNIDNYQINNPNWDDKKLEKYYIDNGIFPSTPPEGSTGLIFENKYPNISNHLDARFPNYSSWVREELESNWVSSTYGANPVEAVEDEDELIIEAKSKSDIKDYNYIGCGPLSVVTQLNFLATNAGYTQFYTDSNANEQKVNLYTDIFNTIKTYPEEGLIGTSLEQLGFSFDSGTFTFPHDLINGVNQILLDYNINNGIGAEDINQDGSYKKMLTVTGDIIPSIASLSTKINKLKSSIDKGMPVIWWTTNDAGDFKNHFMNIFGYEMWTGIDEEEKEFSHLFFKVRMNWGYDDVYMDSDLLNAANGGFIFFEETLPRITISPKDYGFPQAYNNSALSKSINIDGTPLTINRLRTGYINETGLAETGEWHITMSSKKKDAGEAYLEYQLDKPINFIYFDIRLWSSTEGINSTNSEAKLEYKDLSGNWIEAIDFFDSTQNMQGFSNIKHKPDKYRYDFPYGTTQFRFLSTTENPTNASTNKGRIVIGNIGIVFSTNNPNNSCLHVTMFSENDGGSSSFNFSGHAWVEVYNNSALPVVIGKYTLPAFECVTIGLWGNKEHIGVYYNLEYYLAITTIETNSSSSSSSSSIDSSSSSSGSSSGSSSSSMPTWSQGSFGVSSWLYTESRGSVTAQYANGRVSLTEAVSISNSTNLTNVINSHNDEWWPWYNCSHFAIDVWNSVSETDFDKNFIQTPSDLMNKIKEIDGYITNRNISGDRQRVGYYSSEFCESKT